MLKQASHGVADDGTRLSEVLRFSGSGKALAGPGNSPSKTPIDASSPDMKTEESNIYDIAFSGEMLNPWSPKFIGIPLNYLSVGFVYGGSVSILYPILTIKNRTSSAFQLAASNLVTIFWSYKIFFGILSDCFPILGLKRKPYITLGWALCAITLIVTALMGSDIQPIPMVLMLTLANLGYVMADVAADGFMVWMAHREPIERRGRTQTLIYACREFARAMVNLVILFGFSNAEVNCIGFIRDDSQPCNDSLYKLSAFYDAAEAPLPTSDWCHKNCPRASFDFGLNIPQYVWIICAFNILCIPSYFLLFEEKTVRESFVRKLSLFWQIIQKKAVWRVVIYSIISQILFGVSNAAKSNTNNVWLGLNTLQSQIMAILENLIFFLGLNLVRKFFLNTSWRVLIAAGSVLQTVFSLLYLIIVYNIWREPWFYIFTDVSGQFMYTLNFLASVFCIVEVSEPGFEAITYSLITTASNAVQPVATVVSNQFLSFFPDLNLPDVLQEDTAGVHGQFTALLLITITVNLTSLLALPILPSQKKEARELLATGETSKFWGGFVLVSILVFLLYSTVTIFFTVVGGEQYACYKILGGGGCSDTESDVPVYILLVLALGYCYGLTFYHGYLHYFTGKK